MDDILARGGGAAAEALEDAVVDHDEDLGPHRAARPVLPRAPRQLLRVRTLRVGEHVVRGGVTAQLRHVDARDSVPRARQTRVRGAGGGPRPEGVGFDPPCVGEDAGDAPQPRLVVVGDGNAAVRVRVREYLTRFPLKNIVSMYVGRKTFYLDNIIRMETFLAQWLWLLLITKFGQFM